MNDFENILSGFRNPPREFTLLPFWFWNDDLDEAEILRQITDFEAHGVYGFVIHPRVGLPRDIGWMSDRMLHFVHIAVEEAARHDMKVVLYDEGMYPSGSSCGQVVAKNPDFACRGLALVDYSDEKVLLPENANLIAELNTQNGRKIAIIDRKIDSFIRGLHFIGEGPAEDEPPAADLLNPAAMDCFVRLVYDRYFENLGEYFGNTIIGMFTDEPGLLGKCREKNIMPGTTGILEHVNRILGYDFTPHLPALWFDDEPNAARYRADYQRALKKRLEETYYAKLRDWCAAHGADLMGHPSAPDEIGMEKYFSVPGQDIVWRYIEPNKPNALEGAQSTQAKCTSSAMIHHGRRRNSNECFGAYGHDFTEREMWWIANWLFVRGVNMLTPHAFYYSIRGARFEERPPDVGPNSAWWDHYKKFADYCRRLCWLNTDSEHICDVAILGESDRLPWRAAKVLFQNQRDFNYLETSDLETANVNNDGIFLRGMRYESLVLDGDYRLNDAEKSALDILRKAGRLLMYEDIDKSTFIARLDEIAPRDLSITPQNSDLRYRHVRKDNIDLYLLFNEGEQEINGKLSLMSAEKYFWLNPFDVQTTESDLSLELKPHEMKILGVSSRG